ncbi:Emsy N Terminus plant Tudor-like domains-containing protein [Perilla frutescens var. frutescens]|nr:Emsy N Terminus plant Tudor-like domains-containing protein [Perilla frutescens var. frutescens]
MDFSPYEISPGDIKWEGEDPGISRHGGYGGPGRGIGRPLGRDNAPGSGRGRGLAKGQSRKDLPPSQNGIGKKGSDDIQLLHTETLIKEVEKVFSASHPDPVEIEKARKVLKEHELALTEAIARFADLSDGESVIAHKLANEIHHLEGNIKISSGEIRGWSLLTWPSTARQSIMTPVVIFWDEDDTLRDMKERRDGAELGGRSN